ncbi:MAG: SpoIIE family protein phosphatase [Chlorobi bacterium]|nr:SpoIIE family protein phosphatase [Chlorobiota bacterium]
MKPLSSFLFGIVFATISFFAAQTNYAQPVAYKFESLSSDQGLSQGAVFAMLQDSKGFMWFGTKDGLNRYDGYKFTVYKRKLNDTTSLSNNFILSIFEDSRHFIWIGTNGGGVCRFNPLKNNFKRYLNEPGKSNCIGNDIVNSITEDSDGILWFGTKCGLDRFDPIAEEFTHFKYDENSRSCLSNNNVKVVYSPKRGNENLLYVGTDLGGLSVLDRATGKFEHYLWNVNDPNPLNGPIITSIAEDSLGNIWMGAFCDGLFSLDISTGKIKQYLIDPEDSLSVIGNCLRALAFDKKGFLWIGSDDKVIQWFDPQKKVFDFFLYQNDSRAGDVGTGIRSLTIDKSGILWIGSNGFGVSYSFLKGKKFNRIKHDPLNKNSLGFSSVRAISEDDRGNLWASGYPGLNKIDRTNNQVERYFSNYAVYDFCEDPDSSQIIWVGTEGLGLYKFNKLTMEIFRYKSSHMPKPKSLCGSFVYSLLITRDGFLWIGTDRGLNRFDRTSGKFTYYGYNADNPKSLSDGKVKAVYEDKEGKLWVGTTSDGISLFNKKDQTFSHFRHKQNDTTSLSGNNVYSFYEDKKDNFWIGTANGLNLFDKRTRTFKCYSERDGLPNNVVYGILEDDGGNLWLSTNKGLSKFNPSEKSFANFDVDDGLQGNEFNSGAYFKSGKGEMFFGGVNGITEFFPRDFEKNQFKPPVVLTAIKKFNKSVEFERDYSMIDTVELSYKDVVVSFEFAALNFYKSRKNQYAYMLKGLHDDWIKLGAKRELTFTALPAGEYVLQVKAGNNDNVWNEKALKLTLIVSPPPWKTWWAYSLYFLFLGGSLFGFIQWRSHKIIIEKNKLEKTVKQRTGELLELNSKMESELQQAANYIESLLPEKLTKPIKTDWKFLPSSQLGGDAFGYHWLDENNFVFYLIDVSGHGVGAAILCTTVMDILRSRILFDADFSNPAEVLNSLNKSFDIENLNGKYFALWYGIIDKRNYELTCSSAMHPPAIRINGDGIERLGEKNIMIGGMPDYRFENIKYKLNAGDKIYLFSDGCFELEKADGSNLGFDEFVGIILEKSKEKRPIDEIHSALLKTNRENSFIDDYSMIEIELL